MSDLAPIFGTQNLTDDDAAVIDSYLIETDTPPDIKGAIGPIQQPVLPPLPETTRLITGTQVLDSSYVNPYQMLPADANRVSLYIAVTSTVTGPTFNDYVLIADQGGKVSAAAAGAISGASRIRAQAVFSPTQVPMLDHTGAVYLLPGASLSNAIEVSWIAVTK